MAKMKRSALKEIVKECLVEILSEGIASSAKPSLNEARQRKRKEHHMQMEEARLAKHREKFETNVTSTVSQVTDDPVMRDILSHTARTTLQEQVTNDPSSGAVAPSIAGAPGASGGAAGINLDSIFGAPQENWADLAFAEKKTDR